jgi:nitrogen fixation protein FixH
MRKLIGMVVAFGVVVSVSVGAQKPGEQTWSGKISDSNCNAKHPAGEHEGKKMTEADCTGVCVKKGAKYVFVSEGKVYQLANQSSKTIASHAGQDVQLTGQMKGDTITATKIAAAAKPAK